MNDRIVKKKQGFTLIELMVVLLIIGILTSLIAVNVFRAQKQAKIKAASIEIKSLEQAINLFQGEKNRYPKRLEELVSGEFLKEGKLKDQWGKKYIYVPKFSDDGEVIVKYVLFSSGPDRRRDTKDDIGNPAIKKDEE
ncbi:MAG: type II secretion system protein GspG [Spirochaetes bacterium]|nr:type II secretion system protein GspG [Spirochaetota bacterium]